VRIFRFHVALPIVALALIEAVVLLFVPYLAAALRFGGHISAAEATTGPLWPRAVVFVLSLMISMLAMGLYSTRLRANYFGVLLRIAASVFATTVLMVLFFYLFEQRFYLSRGLTAIMALLGFVAAALVRLIFVAYVNEDIFKRRVLVYGCGRQASSILQLRRRADQRGFLVVGYMRAPGDRLFVPAERLLAAEGSLLQFARRHAVHEIVVAVDDRRRAFPVQELLECRLGGIDVIDIVSFLERETGRVRLDVLNPSWFIFSDGFRRDPLRLVSKRAFDVIASLGLLLITWPVMLIVAVAIKIEDGFSAPALYRQARVGLEERVFEVLKFRSMSTDAELDGQARWADMDDARVTRVGAVLRKLRLDELPQIINVLKGDMSFVGPRPERPEFVKALNEKIPYYRERHCVKPGITGWAQLCYPYGSSEHDAMEKLQYDLYYVKNHSLLFDIVILLQTVEIIFWGKGR
jgi:sugar transferase (PEP-CTERM system associated)